MRKCPCANRIALLEQQIEELQARLDEEPTFEDVEETRVDLHDETIALLVESVVALDSDVERGMVVVNRNADACREDSDAIDILVENDALALEVANKITDMLLADHDRIVALEKHVQRLEASPYAFAAES